MKKFNIKYFYVQVLALENEAIEKDPDILASLNSPLPKINNLERRIDEFDDSVNPGYFRQVIYNASL